MSSVWKGCAELHILHLTVGGKLRNNAHQCFEVESYPFGHYTTPDFDPFGEFVQVNKWLFGLYHSNLKWSGGHQEPLLSCSHNMSLCKRGDSHINRSHRKWHISWGFAEIVEAWDPQEYLHFNVRFKQKQMTINCTNSRTVICWNLKTQQGNWWLAWKKCQYFW